MPKRSACPGTGCTRRPRSSSTRSRPKLSELIAAKLGHPTHDPHGDPIPTRDGEIDEAPTRALADLGPGERGVFARVSDSNPEMLRYLSERGIAPGDDSSWPAASHSAARSRSVRTGRSTRSATSLRARCASGPRSNVPEVALANEFQGVIDSLPPDWSHLEIDIRIDDEDRYIEAATILVQVNAKGYRKHDWHWRLARARLRPRGGPETVHGTLTLLDAAGIEGEIVLREARSGASR